MLDFERIKIVTKRRKDAIDIKFIYTFEDGTEKKYHLIKLRDDGLLQNSVFTMKESVELIAEGFNFKQICHPDARQLAAKIATIEDMPFYPTSQFTNIIERKKGGKSYKKLIKSLDEVKELMSEPNCSSIDKMLLSMLQESFQKSKPTKGK